MRQHTVFKSALIALACSAVAIHAVAGEDKQVNVPAGDLIAALKTLAQQSGADLVYRSDQLEGLRTQGVSGTLSAQEAVTKLLEGTTLTLKTDSSGAMLIALPRASTAPSVTGTQNDHSAAGADNQPTADVSEAKRGFWGRFRLAQLDQTRTAEDGSVKTSETAAARKPESGSELEEIIVTATKREERLIDVPQSVTVLSADELAKTGATQLRDYADSVPGLAINTAGAGYTELSLRGVTAGVDVSPTVSIYVDEETHGSNNSLALGSRLALDVGLFDLERIEVLRGPQGTLYGASSIGGLIKYVTKKPSAQGFSGQAMVGSSSTSHGGMSYNGAAAVNVPIAPDKAAVRVSGFYSQDGGYIDNLALGQEDVNSSDIYGGRADLLLMPIDGLSIRVAGFFQNISRDGMGVADFTYAGSPIDGSLEQRRLVAEPFEQRFRSISGTVSYEMDWATLTSISSYQTAETEIMFDLSPLWVPIAAGLGRTYSAMGYFNAIDMKRFVQEMRLASGGAQRLEWLIGGFYSDESSPFVQGFIPFDLGGRPVPNDLFYSARDPLRAKEYAAFGDLTWHLTSQIDVTGGLRYAHGRTEMTDASTGVFGGIRRSGASKEDVVTYLGNARYHFSDHATLYLRYATGYRPGGPNTVARNPVTGAPLAPPTFDADKLKSYEIGFKGETKDRRIAIDMAAFDIDWNNIQVQALRNGIGVRANAPGASIRGAELALTVRPSSAFAVLGTFTYTDAKLSAAAPDLRAANGERLPEVPRFAAALNADYTLPGSFQPTLGVTLRHVAERFAGYEASTDEPHYRIPAYTMVDLRGGFALGRVYTQLYIRNAFDKLGQTSTFNWNRRWAQPGIVQPRTIGVTVTTQF